jgi:hypothetical protein
VQTASLKEALCSLLAIELSRSCLKSKVSFSLQLSRPSSLPSWKPLEMGNGYFNYRNTLVAKSDHFCQSTGTIRVLPPISQWGSSWLEPNTSMFAITSVEICIESRQQIVHYFYVHTDRNVADILITALSIDKHMQFTKAMGLWYLEVDL